MRPTRSASFCNLVTFSCTDRNYATDASKRLRFGDITKYMCSKHSAKFGVSSLKNEVTGYFFIMGKSLCRTLYSDPSVLSASRKCRPCIRTHLEKLEKVYSKEEGRIKHVGGGGNLSCLNLVMMGIERLLTMKAMLSCSTDRTTT